MRIPRARTAWRGAAGALSVLLALVPCGCSRRAGKAPPPARVLLITLDTVRADRLGCYGYAAASTPALDSLAAEGVRFEHAVAPTPITLPSHATILTGAYPVRHGVRNNGTYRLGSEIPTLAELFRASGYRTGAIVASAILDSRFGLDRGFETYDDALQATRAGDLLFAERPASEVTRRALEWIGAQDGPRWFLWLHYFDPHFPYAPPEPFAGRFRERPYDGELAFMDSAIGDLLAGLEARGALQDTLIAVAADHGESLGEHGERSHGVFIYESTLRVPLILSWRSGLPRGRTVSGLARLNDLAPTILELAGLAPPTGAQGISLVTAITGGDTGSPPALLESWLPRLNHGWSELVGLQDADWKYIRAPREELYDLRSDPGEAVNRAALDAERTRDYRLRLESLLQEASAGGSETPVPTGPPDPETERLLRSLGYLGSGDADATGGGDAAGGNRSGPGGGTAGALPDPKDRIAEFLDAGEALLWIASGRLEEGIAQLERAERANPASVFLKRQLAGAYRRQGRIDLAERMLRDALRLNPRHAEAMVELAALRIERPEGGSRGEAEALLRGALRLNPALAPAHHFLGVLHHRSGRRAEAIEEYRAALELEPHSATTVGNLAVLLEESGDSAGALDLYRRGIAIDPLDPRLHTSAAWILFRQGKAAEAVPLLRRASELDSASIRPLLALAQALEATGDGEGALAALREAVRRDPAAAEARLELGRHLLRRGDPCGAAQALEAALQALPAGSTASASPALRQALLNESRKARVLCGR